MARNVRGEMPGGQSSGSAGSCNTPKPAVNLANGALMAQIQPPCNGSYAPKTPLVQNSVGSQGGSFAPGWSGMGAQYLSGAPSSCVNAIDCTGASPHFDSGESDGGSTDYLNPSASYARIQPNGFEYYFPGSSPFLMGSMRTQAKAGVRCRWTVTQESGSPAYKVKSIRDPFNRLTTYAYDGSGRLKRITDVAGRITTFISTAAGITAMIQPDASRVSFTYISTMAGFQGIRSVTMPDGGKTTYSYYADTTSRVKSVVSPSNGITTYSYPGNVQTGPVHNVIVDPRGNETWVYPRRESLSNNEALAGLTAAIKTPLGQRTSYTWATRRLTEARDARGYITTYSYVTAVGSGVHGTRPVRSVYNPASGRFTYVYDSTTGKIKSLINQRNYRTTLLWDSDGFRTAVQNAIGQRTSYTYNSRGQITAVANPLGNRTTYVYDSFGERSAEVNPAGERTSYLYNAAGQVIEKRNPLGFGTTFVYDNMNRARYEMDPFGYRTSYLYDAVGRRTVVITPLGYRSTSIYDIEGRMAVSVDAMGARTTFAYDKNSNLIAVRDALSRRTSYVYDVANRLVASIDPLTRRSTFVYDSAGNQIAIANPLGQRVTTVFDADNRAIAQVDPLGNRSTIVYDGMSSVVATVDPLMRRTTTIYDALNRATVIVNAKLGRVTTVYDVHNRRTATIDADGDRTSYVYDRADRITSTIDALSKRWTNVYDVAGQRVKSIDPLSQTTTFIYDRMGRQVGMIDALGNRSTSVYDRSGRMIRTMTPKGFVTSYIYDRVNRLIGIINPDLSRTSTVYDLAGQQIASVDAIGNRTTFVYDAAGQQSRIQDPLGRLTTSLYEGAGRRAVVVDAESQRTTYAYDAAGRQTRMKNALSQITTTLYDKANATIVSINALRGRTTFSYDEMGRPFRSTNPLGQITTSIFDADSREIVRIDGTGTRTTLMYDKVGRRTGGASAVVVTVVYDSARRPIAGVIGSNERTTYVYNAVNRIVASVDPLLRRTTTIFDADSRPIAEINPIGCRTTYVYDNVGRLVAIQNALRSRTSFTYNRNSQLTLKVDPLLHRTTFTYNGVGAVVSRADARGIITTYLYDKVDRLVRRQYSDNTADTFIYDAIGNRIVAINSAGRFTTSYDGLNRPNRTIDLAGNTITSSYDAVGQRTSMVEPSGGRFTYCYDAAGRTVLVVNPQAERTTLLYDLAGRPTVKRLANGSRTSFGYDSAGRASLLVNSKSDSSIINSFNYAYDKTGSRIGAVEADGSRSTWTYDDNNQLTREVWQGPSGGYDNRYTYDAVGNRLSMNKVSEAYITTYTFDAASQLISLVDNAGSNWTFAYDGCGNPTGSSPGYVHWKWDAENRMRESALTLFGTARTTHTYDPNGLRIKQEQFGSTKNFILDGQNILAETDGSNTTQVVYTLEPAQYGSLVSRRKSGASQYYLFDALGSTDRVLDASQTEVYRYINTAFGESNGYPGADNPFTWLGQLGYYYNGDAHSMYYVRARHYDALMFGRWVNSDPIGYLSDDLNLFRYARNQPLNLVDPSGTACKSYRKDLRIDIPSKDLGIVPVFGIPVQMYSDFRSDYGINLTECPITCSNCRPGTESKLTARVRFGGHLRATAGFDKSLTVNGYKISIWGGVQFWGNWMFTGAADTRWSTCDGGKTNIDLCGRLTGQAGVRIGGQARVQLKWGSWTAGFHCYCTATASLEMCTNCSTDGCTLPKLRPPTVQGDCGCELCIGVCVRISLSDSPQPLPID